MRAVVGWGASAALVALIPPTPRAPQDGKPAAQTATPSPKAR